jgi:hypothetical protein
MQEREMTTRTRKVTKHSDEVHFIVNINSLHNYETITAALPPHLHKSSFCINDTAHLRKTASAQVRDKKHQQMEEKKKLLALKAASRANMTDLVGGTDLVTAFRDDGELLEMMEDVLDDGGDMDANETTTENRAGSGTAMRAGGGGGPIPDDSPAGHGNVPIFEVSQRKQGKKSSASTSLWVFWFGFHQFHPT